MIHNARKHIDSVTAERLPAQRAFVPASFFFGWAVDAGLHNGEELAARGCRASGMLKTHGPTTTG